MAKVLHANAVAMNTATTGTGTITVGTVLDIAHITAAQAGVVDGQPYSYKITDGNDIEFGTSIAGASATTFTRVLKFSKIGGVYSTVNKITLSGAAVFRIIESAEDIDGKAELNNPNLFSDVQSFLLAPVFTDQPGTRQAAYAAPFDAMSYNGIQYNGAMEIDQANVGAAVTGIAGGTPYITDGFFVNNSGTNVLTAQQVSDAPVGFNKSLKVSVTTAEASLGASSYAFVSHVVEGWRTGRSQFGTATPQSITVSFWSKHHRTGLYSGVLCSASGTIRSYPFTYTQTVADTWQYNTVTILGDTTGTWNLFSTSASFRIRWAVAAGTTFTGTAGGWSTANLVGATGTTNGVAATTDTFQLTGVFIYFGTEAPSAGRSPFIARPYDQDMPLALRYFEAVDLSSAGGADPIGAGQCRSTTTAAIIYPFRGVKRTAPAFTISAAGDFLVATAAGTATVTALSLTQDSTFTAQLLATVASGLVAGNGTFLTRNGTNAAAMGFGCRF